MKIWGNIFALGYDRLMAATENADLRTYRENLLQAASGRVLEIGGGTGANLPFYGEGVTELMVAEPEPPMMRQLRRKLDGYRFPTTILSAPAEQVPVPAETFDCVVSTLVLCTVPDPARALAEVRRVLKARGQLLFIEHVRSEDSGLARWQDRLRRPWAWFGHGCQCNRSTVETIRSAGFWISKLECLELPKAPPIVRPLVIGNAARGV
jgi:ubiquinone/menaquinone biosynthesis C-methylase UbiE